MQNYYFSWWVNLETHVPFSCLRGFPKGFSEKLRHYKKTPRQTIKRKHTILKCLLLTQTPHTDSWLFSPIVSMWLHCEFHLLRENFRKLYLGYVWDWGSQPILGLLFSPFRPSKTYLIKQQIAKARKPLRIILSGSFIIQMKKQRSRGKERFV